jgi:hypothetical protein
MPDYYPIVAKAVLGLQKNNAEARRSLYDRARSALIENLRTAQSGEDAVQSHRSALDYAIEQVEAHEAKKEQQANQPNEGLRYHLGVFSFLMGPERNSEDSRPKHAVPEQTSAIDFTHLVAQNELKPEKQAEPSKASAFIFVCYRRDDSAGFAGRIFDRLVSSFSRDGIFMDVDNIEPGLDFVEVLEERVNACKVLLAIIGPNWATANDGHGRRRLDDQHDFVRIELESALRHKVRVIPTLISGARMPRPEELPDSLKPLSRRQAFEIAHASFDRDVEALVRALKRIDDADRST